MSIILAIIKNWKIILGGVLIALLLAIFFMFKTINTLQDKISITTSNNKAYIAEIAGKDQKARVLQLTIDQFKYTNDSISLKLDSVKKVLKIKDKNIKSLQYYKENFDKRDTLKIKGDTIFKKGVNLDTTIIQPFYKLEIKLKYPDTLIVNPSFINEKYIIINKKRETINPPKSCFLLRWFQKKQTVLIIDIVDSNPYLITEKNRFIEILK